MHTLRDLYAYNAWANAKVFAVCLNTDQARFDEDTPGTFGSLTETLTHVAGVEAVYAQMLQDKSPGGDSSREEFYAHDLAWFAETVARVGQLYLDLLANAGDDFYDEPLHVPWFDFTLTKHDGLLQVLSHSAQHRAQVFSVLGQRGITVPDLDYVLYVQERQQPGA